MRPALPMLQAKLPPAEIAATLDDFRTRHLAELTEVRQLAEGSGRRVGRKVTRELHCSAMCRVVKKGTKHNECFCATQTKRYSNHRTLC